MKKYADFCADRIDVITNFAVITNAVIKRDHCILLLAVLIHLIHTLVGKHSRMSICM